MDSSLLGARAALKLPDLNSLPPECSLTTLKDHCLSRPQSKLCSSQGTAVWSPCALPRFKRHAHVNPGQPPPTRTTSVSTFLGSLPDELLLSILSRAARNATSPGCYLHLTAVSKRMRRLAYHSSVLGHLPLAALQLSAPRWCHAACRFLAQCSQASNMFASYCLGMIALYCLDEPAWGLRLLTLSAERGCVEALFSLAIVYFNGAPEPNSLEVGAIGTLELSKARQEVPSLSWADGACVAPRPVTSERDPSRGALLCTQAAQKGHVDALRELGHCLQDGFGVPAHAVMGKALLVRANKFDTVRWEVLMVKRDCAAHELSPCKSGSGEGDWKETDGSTKGVRQRQVHLRESAHLVDGTHLHPWGVSPERAVDSAPAEESSTHQCFCLPAVTVPLEDRRDGWVHRFLVNWHCLHEERVIGSEGIAHDKPHGLRPSVTELNHMSLGQPVKGSAQRKVCGSAVCGRRELRAGEFRCCSACSQLQYCSRVCQAQHWKMGHKDVCG